MDDPWGSPWADESTTVSSTGASEQAVVAPPVIHKNHHVGTPSWEDNNDGDFGDWAALPADEDLTSASLNTLEGEERWGVDMIETESFKQVESNDTKPNWFTRDTSFLKTNDDSPPEAILRRESSPDPWAKEELSLASSSVSQAPGTDVPEFTESTDHGHSLQGDDLKADDEDVEDERESPDTDVYMTEVDTASDDTVVASKPEQDGEAEIPSSRPSSSPSDGSHIEARPDESSRTSFEDEPKRPPIERDPPSKVKHLVQHFDKLAVALQQTEDENDALDHQDDVQNQADLDTKGGDAQEPIAAEADDDFGDFEEGEEDDDENNAESNEADVGDESDIGSAIATKKPPAITNDIKSDGSPITAKQNSSAVPFIIDAKLVEQLFSNLDNIEVAAPTPDQGLPTQSQRRRLDTIEQRKVWYRISRYGTLGRHNAGNDESYVRAHWAKSQARDDTLKIVARWMEEDRIGRGVVLGGSNRLGSLFGWRDNTGMPGGMSDQNFKQERFSNEQHSSRRTSQSLSKGRNSRGSSRKNSATLPSLAPPIVQPPPPVTTASFSWSSSKPPSAATTYGAISLSRDKTPVPAFTNFGFTTTNTPSPPQAQSGTSDLDLIFGSQQESPASFQVPEPARPTQGQVESPAVHAMKTQYPINISPPSAAASISDVRSLSGLKPTKTETATRVLSDLTLQTSFEPALQEAKEDDDDDWGEMVASPVVKNPIAPISTSTPPTAHFRQQNVSASIQAKTQNLDMSPQGSSMDTITPNELDSIFGLAPTKSRGHKQKLSLSEEIATRGRAASILGEPALHPPTRRTPRGSVSTHEPLVDFTAEPRASSGPQRVSSTNTRPRRPRQLSLAADSTPDIAAKTAPLETIFSAGSPTAGQSGGGFRSKEEIEQERIVQDIVHNLPNLSYMLRR